MSARVLVGVRVRMLVCASVCARVPARHCGTGRRFGEPPGKRYCSSALGTGASITCWNFASVFDRVNSDHILLETADGNRLTIDKTGSGSIDTVDTNGNPRRLPFGKALLSPHVHNLLSPGAMFEQGATTDVRLRKNGGYVQLSNGVKIPLRSHARLFYLDYLVDDTTTTGPSAGTDIFRPATASLAGLPREDFYEAPKQPFHPVHEATDFLPPLEPAAARPSSDAAHRRHRTAPSFARRGILPARAPVPVSGRATRLSHKHASRSRQRHVGTRVPGRLPRRSSAPHQAARAPTATRRLHSTRPASHQDSRLETRHHARPRPRPSARCQARAPLCNSLCDRNGAHYYPQIK